MVRLEWDEHLKPDNRFVAAAYLIFAYIILTPIFILHWMGFIRSPDEIDI